MYFTIERNEESEEERLKVGERSHFSSVDSRIEITFYEKSVAIFAAICISRKSRIFLEAFSLGE